MDVNDDDGNLSDRSSSNDSDNNSEDSFFNLKIEFLTDATIIPSLFNCFASCFGMSFAEALIKILS